MKLLKVPEVAVFLRLSKSKIYDLVSKRKLRHYKIDGTILVSEEQLQLFLHEHEKEKRGDPAPRSRSLGAFTHLDPQKLAEAWKDE